MFQTPIDVLQADCVSPRPNSCQLAPEMEVSFALTRSLLARIDTTRSGHSAKNVVWGPGGCQETDLTLAFARTGQPAVKLYSMTDLIGVRPLPVSA